MDSAFSEELSQLQDLQTLVRKLEYRNQMLKGRNTYLLNKIRRIEHPGSQQEQKQSNTKFAAIRSYLEQLFRPDHQKPEVAA